MRKPPPLMSIFILACLLSDSALTTANALAQFQSEFPAPSPERDVGRGAACYMGGKSNGVISYAVREIGQSTVPKLQPTDASLLKRIQTYVKSRTLRFAYSGTQFVVFDAPFGPCEIYRTLNLGCATGFDPMDNTLALIGTPGPCLNTRRPWMDEDTIGGTVPWQKVYGFSPR